MQHGELAHRVGEAVAVGDGRRAARGEDDSSFPERLHHPQGVLGDDGCRHEVQVELLLEVLGIEVGQKRVRCEPANGVHDGPRGADSVHQGRDVGVVCEVGCLVADAVDDRPLVGGGSVDADHLRACFGER
jgi:hypothetical protein